MLPRVTLLCRCWSHLHRAEGRFDPRPLDMEVLMDNLPSAGSFLRVRLIPPVGAVRQLRHTPFHLPADDSVQYKLTASLKVSCSVCCSIPTRRVALLFGTRTHNTSQETCGVASVPFRVNSSIRITYLLTPWSRVLLEKLTGFQLVKKFPKFYGTRIFITPVTSFDCFAT